MLILQRRLDPRTDEGAGNGGADLDGLVTAADLKQPEKVDDTNKGKDTQTPATTTTGTTTTSTTNTDADKEAQILASKRKELGLADNASKEDIEAAEKKKLDDAAAGTFSELELEIDGKVEVFKINEKGEAVDATGKVVKTKAEVDAIAQEQRNQQEPLVVTLQKKSGYTLLDENNKPKVYEDTEEGILEMATDIAVLKANEAQKKYFEMFPDVREYAEFRQRGGNKADFFKRQAESWSNVKFDAKNEDLCKNVLRATLSKTMNKEQVEDTLQLYKDTGKLEGYGKTAYDNLVKEEVEFKKREKETFERQEAENTQKVEQYWNETHEVIKKGNLNNIIIPEADRDGFFKYISEAVDDNGRSQAIVDRQKLPREQLLQLEYLQYKGFNLKGLIEAAAKTERARTLRSKMTGGNQSGVGDGEGIDRTKYQKPSDNVDITIDKLY